MGGSVIHGYYFEVKTHYTYCTGSFCFKVPLCRPICWKRAEHKDIDISFHCILIVGKEIKAVFYHMESGARARQNAYTHLTAYLWDGY